MGGVVLVGAARAAKIPSLVRRKVLSVTSWFSFKQQRVGVGVRVLCVPSLVCFLVGLCSSV